MTRTVAILLTCASLAMAATLAYGFGWGGGWAEVRLLLEYPWFVVSLVDVYVGFAFVAGWIAYREGGPSALVWIALLLTLGNLIAAIYALLALRRSGGDWRRFWLGRRASMPLTPPTT